MVFSAFELRVDVLMAMQLNGSEVEALLPPANATNVSALGALLISAILFRCAQEQVRLSVWRSFSATGTRSRQCGCLPTLPTRPRRARLPWVLSICLISHCRKSLWTP